MINKILEEIKSSETILILTHKRPDGDAIGSVCALGLLLKSMGKKVQYVVDPMVSKKMKIGPEAIFFADTTDRCFDLVIALDCADTDFLYGGELLKSAAKSIVIDHHVTNKNYGTFNYVKPAVAAVGEIIMDLYEAAKIGIGYEAASWLYLSLSTDTGNFRYSNVTAQTHLKAAKLFEIRNDFSAISQQMEKYGMARLRYLARVIEHIQLLCQNKVAVSYLELKDYENKVMDEETDLHLQDMVNVLRNIEDVEVSVFLKQEKPGAFKASMRSNGTIDVAKIAQRFGGGGHKKAAGCDINGEIQNIIASLKKEICAQNNL